MIISIKDYLRTKQIQGDVILYRDRQHKKKPLCEYLAQNINTDKTICVYSGGAFGLYMAKAFCDNQIVICGNPTKEYKQQIDRLNNATITKIPDGDGNILDRISRYAQQNNFYFLNPMEEPLIEQYYGQHLISIVEELGDISIDAFCDCGHSCATMSGFITSQLTDWQFVLGIRNDVGSRTKFYYLQDKMDKFAQETTKNFDTKQIQNEIESMYPDFGNIFEATRSISAAMSWLQKNPNKAVLVYVGDSPVYGEDVEI